MLAMDMNSPVRSAPAYLKRQIDEVLPPVWSLSGGVERITIKATPTVAVPAAQGGTRLLTVTG